MLGLSAHIGPILTFARRHLSSSVKMLAIIDSDSHRNAHWYTCREYIAWLNRPGAREAVTRPMTLSRYSAAHGDMPPKPIYSIASPVIPSAIDECYRRHVNNFARLRNEKWNRYNEGKEAGAAALFTKRSQDAPERSEAPNEAAGAAIDTTRRCYYRRRIKMRALFIIIEMEATEEKYWFLFKRYNAASYLLSWPAKIIRSNEMAAIECGNNLLH